MIEVTVYFGKWHDYKENAWGGALTTLDDVEAQDKEKEAMEIIEKHMSEDTLGYIPNLIELNDFLWFNLPDIMHLYDNEDEEYEEDEEEEEEE